MRSAATTLSLTVALAATTGQPALAESSGHPPKIDPKPVDITVGSFHYRIPGNYVVSAGSIPTLQAAFPGAKPFTPATADCFTKPKAHRPQDCVLIEFWLETHSPYVTDETFFRFRDLFHNKEPKPGPYGFDLYEFGPDNARVEAYRKVGSDGAVVVAQCMIFDNRGRRDGICDTGMRTRSGIYAAYRFGLDELYALEGIDRGLRDLIDSFAIEKP